MPNYLKVKKAETSRLISRELASNLERLIVVTQPYIL